MKKFIVLLLSVSCISLLNGNSAFADSFVRGDANNDGKFTSADLVYLQKWILDYDDILINSDNSDLCADGIIDVFDLCQMRKEFIDSQKPTNIVRVTNTDELKAALADVEPNDEIILASGDYIYSGSTSKGYMFKGEADGTESEPIVLRSENPENPAVISGINVSENYALSVTGDWWVIRDLKITNASKGIILDNSNHTKLINCEVYNIGSEGIHFRDNSSYCLAENCFIHDTGLVSPAYGEGIYIGSSKSTSGYGYKCDYNTIRGCSIGPNVAAEHIDIKEYTTGTIVENCIFDGIGMSGENYADSFVDIQGNDCILRYCTGYRNGCSEINYAFSMNKIVDGWGQNAYIYGNKAYMDTSVNALGKKMVFLNSWDCSETVWDNYLAYESGELFPIDDEKYRWDYYNCSDLTYGDYSIEENLR